MGLISLIKAWVVAVKSYIAKNFDHFMISIGVSIVVTVIANVAIHYGADLLRLMHVPAKLVHMMTGN
jgi:hypothetical protein